jgi:hypothetical protein
VCIDTVLSGPNTAFVLVRPGSPEGSGEFVTIMSPSLRRKGRAVNAKASTGHASLAILDEGHQLQ